MLSIILATREALAVYTVIEIYSGPSLRYELSFGTSLTKVSRDGCKVFYMLMKNKKIDLLFYNYFMIISFLLTTKANNTKC